MSGPIIVLTGGVGGSKLVDGLACLVPDREVHAIVNTGDDFVHFGLSISPDIDTLLYTLSGLAHPEHGWGRRDESWNFMEAAQTMGADQWFRLGDRDLVLHVLRTEALRQGARLSSIIAGFARSLGVRVTVLPMSDDTVSTMVETDAGLMPFQRYFVRLACRPSVRAIRFEGAATAVPAPGVVEAICDSDASAILVAPSNPFLSIDPILAVPGIRDALRRTATPVVAVSPLVAGRAVKGPTAKIMEELGYPVSASAIVGHYGDLLDGILVDERDPEVDLPIPALRADTLMIRREDRIRVASVAVELAESLQG